jgi:hypothetical protein
MAVGLEDDRVGADAIEGLAQGLGVGGEGGEGRLGGFGASTLVPRVSLPRSTPMMVALIVRRLGAVPGELLATSRRPSGRPQG